MLSHQTEEPLPPAREAAPDRTATRPEHDERQERPTVIGRCRFGQLPTEYQRRFERGPHHEDDSFFVAEKYPWSSLILMPFYLLISAAPIGLVVEVPQIPVWPWVLPGVITFTAAALLSARCLVWIVRSVRASKNGRKTYGLLFDDRNLVVRRLELWKVKNCVFLPRSEIDHFRMSYELHAGSGSRAERTLLVNAHRRLASGKDYRICVSYGDWLELKPTEVHEALQAALTVTRD